MRGGVDNRNWCGIFPWQRAVREDSLPAAKRCCGEIPSESVWRAFVEADLGPFAFHSDVEVAAALAECLQALVDQGRRLVVPEIEIRRDEGGPCGVNDGVLSLLEEGKRISTGADFLPALEVDESDLVKLGADAEDEAPKHLHGLLASPCRGAESRPFVFEFHPVLGSLDSQKIGNDSASHTGADGHAGHSILRLAEKFLIALDAAVGKNAQKIIGEFVIPDCGLGVDDHAYCGLQRLDECGLQGALLIGAFAHNFDFVDFPRFPGQARLGSEKAEHDSCQYNPPELSHR